MHKCSVKSRIAADLWAAQCSVPTTSTMEILSMCRVCLAGDVRMQLVADSRLLEMYELLTLTALETNVNRPIQVCYICYAKLQNCYQLRKLCRRSEELFTEMLRKNVLTATALGEVPNANTLTVTPVVNLSVGCTEEENRGCDLMLKEAPELLDYFEVKVEPVEVPVIQEVEDAITTKNTTPSSMLKAQKSKQGKVNDAGLTFFEKEPSGVTEIYPGAETPEDPLSMPRSPKDAKRKNKSIKSKKSRKPIRRKPYSCDTCQKRFTTNTKLSIHIRTHTGEKTYQCDTCNKFLKTKNYLITHMRIHTGNHPFQCNICQKSFYQKHHLTSHMRVHTGEKPHLCYICNKSFRLKAQLFSHINIHTGSKQNQCGIHM